MLLIPTNKCKQNKKNDFYIPFLTKSACQYLSRMTPWMVYNFLPSHVPLTLSLIGICLKSFIISQTQEMSMLYLLGHPKNCREMKMSDSSCKNHVMSPEQRDDKWS